LRSDAEETDRQTTDAATETEGSHTVSLTMGLASDKHPIEVTPIV